MFAMNCLQSQNKIHEICHFLRYQVAIDTNRKNPLIVERGTPLVAKFSENLSPGRTYQVDF